MDSDRKTLVSLATYNEIDNLPRLVDEIFAVAPQVHVLVVDDHSPDGTGEWCDRRRAADPRLDCLHRPGKLGLGTATIAAMRYAIMHGYRYMVNMDADFSHQPRYLPDLLAAIEQSVDGRRVDVAIGSRYVAGGGVEGWPLRRRLMSRGVNWYARRILGLTPRDCSGAFRCYRTEMLAHVDFDEVRSRGYSFQEEILWRLKQLGACFCEVPITFVDRQKGRSKIGLRESWSALRVIASLGWSSRSEPHRAPEPAQKAGGQGNERPWPS
jgi:dolichol-phosphate mannosyltransferase